MELRTVIQLEDWDAYTKFLSERALSKRSVRLLQYLSPVAIGVTILWIFNTLYWIQVDIFSFFVGYAALFIGAVITNSIFTQRTRPEVEGFSLGPRKLRVAAEGLYEGTQTYKIVYFWSAIQDVAVTSEHLFLVMDRNAAITIPRRAFENEAACEAFQTEIKRYREAAASKNKA